MEQVEYGQKEKAIFEARQTNNFGLTRSPKTVYGNNLNYINFYVHQWGITIIVDRKCA